MGVPAFYRWLSEKYPKIVQDLLEQRDNVIDGTVVPINLNEPNPNGVEYDNLYVDMNGLIHPCSHPEDRESPTSEREMYVNVTKYIDRLVAAVRPRRLLFLAIDGVAPRAKMNQQRSRRFRAAQDAKERKDMLQDVINDMVALGYDAPESSQEWDSNVITPGTTFMAKISIFLRFYILDKMNRHPYWRGIKVILSDASEPGEGEHKIMNYIRNQRGQFGYDPNQRHILHGLDADLIMLALATHEAHFTILREKVSFGRKSRNEPEKSQGQIMLDAQWIQSGARLSELRPQDEWIFAKPLQALHVHVLRDYLNHEFRCLASINSPPYDLERIIDDFIFLCFFVGNDFLPHLPSLDIRDGALDFLLEVYKEILPSLGDYLTSPGGNLNLEQVDVILGRVGEIEDIVFQKKKEAEDLLERRKAYQSQNYSSKTEDVKVVRKQIEDLFAVKQQPPPQQQPYQSLHGGSDRVGAPPPVLPTAGRTVDANHDAALMFKERFQGGSKRHIIVDDDTNKRFRSSDPPVSKVTEVETETEVEIEIKGNVGDSSSIPVNPEVINIDDDEEDCDEEIIGNPFEPTDALRIIPIKPIEALMPKKKLSKEEMETAKLELKRRIAEKEQSMFDKYRQTILDEVKLHESGWKDRYYGEKHKKENIAENGGLSVMCQKYIHGLCWVLKYYYEGVPSWNWYYPFHYAPFASDLLNIERYGPVEFERSEPFRPVEQLLAVLPSNSVHALPEPCRWLMTDASSPIIDLYNDDVPIDPNGKHLPWLWILLLPFIDESRITAAFSICKPDLTLQDRRRNAFGGSVLFVHKDSPLATHLLSRITYAPGSETDVEVIDALRVQEQQHDSIAVSDSRQVDFDAAVGRGMSGEVGPPPPLWFAPLYESIEAPVDEDDDSNSNSNSALDVFNSLKACIYNNSVAVFSYILPAAPEVHQSQLLDGALLSPSILTSFDLIDRKAPRLNKAGFSILDMLREVRNKSQGGRQSGFARPQYDNQGYRDPFQNQHQNQSSYNGNHNTQSFDRHNQWNQQSSSMHANTAYSNQSCDDQYRHSGYGNNNQSYPFQQRSVDHQPRPPQSNYHGREAPSHHATTHHHNNNTQRAANYSEGSRRPDGGYPQSYGAATSSHHSQLPSFGQQLARGGQPSLLYDMPGRGDVDRRGNQHGSSRNNEPYNTAPHWRSGNNSHEDIHRQGSSSRYGDRVDTSRPSQSGSSDSRSNSGYGRQAPQQPQQQQYSRNPYSHQQQQQQQLGRAIQNDPVPRSYSYTGGMPGPPPRYSFSDARPPAAAFTMNPAAAPFQFHGSQKQPTASTSSQIGSMQSIRDQLLQTVNAVKRK